MKNRIIVVILLLTVLLMLNSCSFFYSDNCELVNPVDMLWEWMDTNEIPLAVEIFAFIISLPIFVLIAVVGIVLSIIFGAFELVATVIYLIIVFLGYIIIAAKELFGI